jgi:hypothetical protein
MKIDTWETHQSQKYNISTYYQNNTFDLTNGIL